MLGVQLNLCCESRDYVSGNGSVVQCTLVRNSAKLETRVDLAGAIFVGPIRKFKIVPTSVW